MNRITRYLRLTLAFALFGILLVIANRDVLAQQNPDVLPRQAAIYGETYGQWSAAWWQWMLSIPSGSNPTFFPDGTGCGSSQSGHVWFLAEPNSGSGPAEECTVPVAKSIFVPIVNAECSSVEGGPPYIPSICNDDATCRACAKSLADQIDPTSLKASVDEMPVNDLTIFRVQSPLFHFSIPANNWFSAEGLIAPAGTGIAVSDGYWLMIKPLSPGQHKIHVEGAIPSFSFSEKVNFFITVRQP
ncbi:hypothetical protein [Trinickia mobilis]|uniref:hypothetical protein n=1 Tax=Trinickia mobilis TaxID=2816356 RepID=UPI001A8EE2A7|nr:hypothetical protein [Trinickia mobilis]